MARCGLPISCGVDGGTLGAVLWCIKQCPRLPPPLPLPNLCPALPLLASSSPQWSVDTDITGADGNQYSLVGGVGLAMVGGDGSAGGH